MFFYKGEIRNFLNRHLKIYRIGGYSKNVLTIIGYGGIFISTNRFEFAGQQNTINFLEEK